MDIPYTVAVREDTGTNNVKLGIWLFLTSEVMLFGSLFASYVLLRSGSTHWPMGREYLNVPLATVNTFVLIASSVTMVMAWASAVRNDLLKFRLYLGGTIMLGLVFLVIKYIEYTQKFHHELFPSTNTFLAIYFTMTGLHALHVIGGTTVNAYLLGPGSRMWSTNHQQFANRVECAGLFWHLVDLIWIFLFPVLYLL